MLLHRSTIGLSTQLQSQHQLSAICIEMIPKLTWPMLSKLLCLMQMYGNGTLDSYVTSTEFTHIRVAKSD